MNVLTCDSCTNTENEENELDWLKTADSYGWNGDFCSWECLRDFAQDMVDNPPEGIEDVPELQPDPEEEEPKKAAGTKKAAPRK